MEDSIKIDGRVEVVCEQNGSTATIVLHAPQHGGQEITVEKVIEELNRMGWFLALTSPVSRG